MSNLHNSTAKKTPVTRIVQFDGQATDSTLKTAKLLTNNDIHYDAARSDAIDPCGATVMAARKRGIRRPLL